MDNNMKYPRLNTYFVSTKLVIYGLTLWCCCSSAQAGFSVMEDETYYGNAQSETFRRAIENEAPLDSQDRAFLASVQELRTTNRWYFKSLVGRPQVTLKNVKNVSPQRPAPAPKNQLPNTREAKDDALNLDLAFGYKWKRWALEHELLIGESLHYHTVEASNVPSIRLASSIKNIATFLNVQYDLPTFFDFIPKRVQPYALMGLGVSLKTADNTTQNLTGGQRYAQSTRSTALAWHGGLGVQVQVTGSLLANLAFRYYQFNDLKMGPIDEADYTLKWDSLVSRGFYLGLTYQL
jgi:hypothetical protein